MPYVYALDPTVPANSDLVSAGAGNIRDFKNAVIERLNTFFTDIQNADPLVVSDSASFGKINANGGTVTASVPVLSMIQTWNNGAVVFTGVKLNITNTASAAGSLLADLQVGGSSKFNVDKTGLVTNAGGIQFNTSGPVQIGGINKTATNGLAVQAVTGATNDFILFDAVGTSGGVFAVPVGTRNAVFGGSVTVDVFRAGATTGVVDIRSAGSLRLWKSDNSTSIDLAYSGGIVNVTAGATFGGGLTVTSASITVGPIGAVNTPWLNGSGNDQSNARIRLSNTGAGGGKNFDLVAGTPGASNAGFAIHNQTDSVVLAQWTNAGALMLPNTVTISAGGLTVSSGTSALQAVTATSVTASGNIQLATNATVLQGKTSGGATVNLLTLTADVNNITRFTAGVDAGGFQWTNQAAAASWMGLTASGLAVTTALGVGALPSANAAIFIGVTQNNASTQYGILNQPTFGSAVTSDANAIYAQVFTAAAAFTMSRAIAVHIADASKGAGSSITSNYAIYIEPMTSGGTNYAIYTNTGLVRFGDNVLIVQSNGGTQHLNIDNSATAAGRNWHLGYSGFGLGGVSEFSFYNITDSITVMRLGALGNVNIWGDITVAGSSFMIHTTNTLTNAAASNTATLTNAPRVGNPLKWIQIDDAGTTRYIPTW